MCTASFEIGFAFTKQSKRALPHNDSINSKIPLGFSLKRQFHYCSEGGILQNTWVYFQICIEINGAAKNTAIKAHKCFEVSPTTCHDGLEKE
jgi:hypothetical protein